MILLINKFQFSVFFCLLVITKLKLELFLQNAITQLGPYQFACPYCPRIMKSRAQMIRHVRVHTGEKPFKCPYCDYSSNQKAKVPDHISRKHKKDFYKVDL